MLKILKRNRKNTQWRENIYPYLFQTSGFSTIDAIRAEIESQPNWDFAPTGKIAIQIQDRAALRYGIKPPYSKEEFALRKILYVTRAGSNIATYAWGLYAESIKQARQIA